MEVGEVLGSRDFQRGMNSMSGLQLGARQVDKKLRRTVDAAGSRHNPDFKPYMKRVLGLVTVPSLQLKRGSTEERLFILGKVTAGIRILLVDLPLAGAAAGMSNAWGTVLGEVLTEDEVRGLRTQLDASELGPGAHNAIIQTVNNAIAEHQDEMSGEWVNAVETRLQMFDPSKGLPWRRRRRWF